MDSLSVLTPFSLTTFFISSLIGLITPLDKALSLVLLFIFASSLPFASSLHFASSHSISSSLLFVSSPIFGITSICLITPNCHITFNQLITSLVSLPPLALSPLFASLSSFSLSSPLPHHITPIRRLTSSYRFPCLITLLP